jgi:hypothetical protein
MQDVPKFPMLNRTTTSMKHHQMGLSPLGCWILSNQRRRKRVVKFFNSHVHRGSNKLNLIKLTEMIQIRKRNVPCTAMPQNVRKNGRKLRGWAGMSEKFYSGTLLHRAAAMRKPQQGCLFYHVSLPLSSQMIRNCKTLKISLPNLFLNNVTPSEAFLLDRQISPRISEVLGSTKEFDISVSID